MQQQATSATDSGPATEQPRLDGPFPLESVMPESARLMPERALLVAILKQAYHDATCPPESSRMRVIALEAKAFFAEPGRLEWFCSFLDVDPERWRKAAAVIASRKRWVFSSRASDILNS
jgi:hypothetical protein